MFGGCKGKNQPFQNLFSALTKRQCKRLHFDNMRLHALMQALTCGKLPRLLELITRTIPRCKVDKVYDPRILS